MKEKVLIVEDERDVAKLLSMILENEGYQCFHVNSGEELFAFLENETIDIIILDIILPGMDGYEVCRRLKTRRETNMIPIIVLTAKVFAEDIQHGLRVGADRYVTKPFEQDALLADIRDQLEKRDKKVQEGVNGEIYINILSDLKYLEELNEMTNMFFQNTELCEKDINDIKYVLAEIGKNAIEWGNRNRKELPVHIRYITDHEKLTIQIRDEGSGFNFDHYLDFSYNPSGEYEKRKKENKRSGGLGIMLAKVYMDEISYNEKGNEVTMVKYYDSGTGE